MSKIGHGWGVQHYQHIMWEGFWSHESLFGPDDAHWLVPKFIDIFYDEDLTINADVIAQQLDIKSEWVCRFLLLRVWDFFDRNYGRNESINASWLTSFHHLHQPLFLVLYAFALLMTTCLLQVELLCNVVSLNLLPITNCEAQNTKIVVIAPE